MATVRMRDDFSKAVKRKLAARAGHKCSNPSCRAETSGPHLQQGEVVNVGVAAHISAAAEGGPRYNPNLSPANRSSVNNAIWLCQNCAKHIDDDESRHTQQLLLQWKSGVEEEAYRRVGKAQTTRSDSPRTMIGEKQLSTQSTQREFLDELITFCSESKAATTKFFLARPTKDNPQSRQEYIAAYAACELHDAKGQRLQLRAREDFGEGEVQHDLFELLRRTSLSRQSLILAQEGCRDRAFMADQEWVEAQIRRVISTAARAAGFDLERGELPFIVGSHASFVGETERGEPDGQPPSSRIAYEYEVEKIKARTEAEGRVWDPSPFELKRDPPKRRPEPTLIPRRDSEPELRGRGPISQFPFEEKHVLWLAGYDSRPALVLRDHLHCQLRVRVATRNIQPIKTYETFKQGKQPIDIISPRISTKANDLLRGKSSRELQEDLTGLENELRTRLNEDFAEFGYDLLELSILYRLSM